MTTTLSEFLGGDGVDGNSRPLPPASSGGHGGAGGHLGLEVRFNSPSSSWTCAVPSEFTDRLPAVQIVLSTGEVVFSDVTIASGTVTVTFSQAHTGKLILS